MKYLGFSMMFILISLVLLSCKAQYKFKYQQLPSIYKHFLNNSKYIEIESRADTYDLTRSLPRDFVTDGSIDYTRYIQEGINRHRNVVFPNFPILINEKGISLVSNSQVYFRENSKVIMKPNDAENYQILRVFNQENISIYAPVLIGDRFKHKGKKGEWGMGISIAGSYNIKVVNPKIKDCWGDGIYIGKINHRINKNITIENALLDGNRRNGISITCVDGLFLKSPIISNTHGTPPMSGIDIEPNDNTDQINNIIIKDPITFNNKYGILVVLMNLPGHDDKTVDIEISDHIDDTSLNGFLLSGANAKNRWGNKLLGKIKVINPTWKNNINEYKGVYKFKYMPQVEVINPNVFK